MTPRQRINGWNKRLKKMKVSKTEWTVRYFPKERRYKRSGEFTYDDDGNSQGWIPTPVWYIERILWEFEQN